MSSVIFASFDILNGKTLSSFSKYTLLFWQYITNEVRRLVGQGTSHSQKCYGIKHEEKARWRMVASTQTACDTARASLCVRQQLPPPLQPDHFQTPSWYASATDGSNSAVGIISQYLLFRPDIFWSTLCAENYYYFFLISIHYCQATTLFKNGFLLNHMNKWRMTMLTLITGWRIALCAVCLDRVFVVILKKKF